MGHIQPLKKEDKKDEISLGYKVRLHQEGLQFMKQHLKSSCRYGRLQERKFEWDHRTF